MKQDRRLAYLMLTPTALIVLGIVLFPLFVNFWISFKPVKLSDLRPPEVFVSPSLRGTLAAAGDEIRLRYRLRNGSLDKTVSSVVLRDSLPPGVVGETGDERCSLTGQRLECVLGDWEPKRRETITIVLRADETFSPEDFGRNSFSPSVEGEAEFTLTSFEFNFDNYLRIYADEDFFEKLRITFFYTFFGTLGALIMGLFAAQLLNVPFRGRAFLRGLLLFPYVSPVIAVAFTWIFFLDPFSGVLNSLFRHYEATDAPINFLGTRTLPVSVFGVSFEFPLALVTVTAFEIWRYFPLAFLFILARMQSFSKDVFEAASIDGASPFQQFFHISLPQLIGIMSVLFLLRFIWTFNKFDDIFLMTGGASGTTTLTVDVYKQAFALSDLGAGAAVAVTIFILLAIFAALQIKFATKDESL